MNSASLCNKIIDLHLYNSSSCSYLHYTPYNIVNFKINGISGACVENLVSNILSDGKAHTCSPPKLPDDMESFKCKLPPPLVSLENKKPVYSAARLIFKFHFFNNLNSIGDNMDVRSQKLQKMGSNNIIIMIIIILIIINIYIFSLLY